MPWLISARCASHCVSVNLLAVEQLDSDKHREAMICAAYDLARMRDCDVICLRPNT